MDETQIRKMLDLANINYTFKYYKKKSSLAHIAKKHAKIKQNQGLEEQTAR